MARVFVQDRRRDRPGVRPNHGLLSRPLAPPQPRHSAMREVTPPIAHRADVHSENRRDRPGVPSLQRQQDRPCPIRFAAMLRFRQVTQHRLFRGIRRQLRFSRHAWPPQPSSQANNPFHRPFAGGLLSTGLSTEICFDLLSRTPEEIAADSRQIERLYSSVSALAAKAAPATLSSIAITSAFLREEMRPSLPLEAQSAARRLRHWALAVVLLAFAFFLLTILVLVYVDRGRRELQQLEHARSEYQLVLGVIHQSRDPDLLANCLSAVPVEATSDLRGGPGAQPLCDRLWEARYRLRIARVDLEAWNTLWNRLSFMPPGRPTQEPQDRLQPALLETQWGASELHASVNMAGLTGFVLPMLLGLLGAFTYVYRNIDSKIRAATLSSSDGAHATLRILLGMMLGGLLGVIWTNGQPIELEGVTLSLAALAFFVGYGVEVVFQMLDRIIARTVSGFRGQT